MDSSWVVPIVPKVLFKPVERFGRSRLGFGGVDPRVLFIPRSPGHTGLTGASHRSDRWNPYCVSARVNVWVCSLLSCVAAISSLGQFGAWLACLVFWSFLAETGLTGVLHRPDRCGATLWKLPSSTSRDRSDWCWSVDSRFGVPLRSRVCEVGSWFLGSVALQWLRGLGQFGYWVGDMCWKPCSSCWSLPLLQEEFLSAPIHSPPLWFAVSVLQISSPRYSMRAIWVPKHLVTNPIGPNKCWVPRNAYWACKLKEMHWVHGWTIWKSLWIQLTMWRANSYKSWNQCHLGN
jgi:hypothetical protein